MEFLQDPSWNQFYFGISFNGFSTKNQIVLMKLA